MSFLIDPPLLFFLGMVIYYIGRRWRFPEWSISGIMCVICFIGFMTISTILYLDLSIWPYPYMSGSEWMFHTHQTGITRGDVEPLFVIFMFLLYPLWHILGYVFGIKLDEGMYFLPSATYEDVKSRKEIDATKVAVRRGESSRQILREAIDAVGGLGEFVKPDDRVLLKPNISGGNPTIQGSFTSIEIVDELVKMIRDLGAHPVVVDSDMIWTKWRPVAEAQGWIKWASEKDVELINLAESKWMRFDFGSDSAVRKVPVSKELVEADVIISIPTMKTHVLTNITIAMKNMYGTFPQESKGKYHRFGIEDVIFEVNNAFTPNLTIIDGTIGGEAWGPLSSKPVNFQTVIVSNDVVAADAVACQLIGFDPMDVVHIKTAHDNGLGDGLYKFDMSTLPFSHPKDGKWLRSEPLVTAFYEALCELVLLLPGMQAFFDLAADFVLFDLATLPILRELTRMELGILNDIFGALFRSGYKVTKWTSESILELQGNVQQWIEEVKG